MKSLLFTALISMTLFFSSTSWAMPNNSAGWGICENLAGYAGLSASTQNLDEMCWIENVSTIKVASRYDVLVQCRSGQIFYAIVYTAFKSFFSCDVKDVEIYQGN